MKQIIILLFIILQSVIGFTQVPQKMSYQAVIRNEQDELLYEEPVGIRISILRGSENIYTETHTVTSNMNGLITLEIGAGITTDSFSKIDWGNGSYFIKTETDPKGGTNYSITTVSQMLSVPYALYAGNAGNIDSLKLEIKRLSELIKTTLPFKHYIGELFGGGVICDLWKDSIGEEHGLIMSLVDIGDTTTGQNWDSGPTSSLVGAFNYYDGLENSIKIAQVYPGSAAATCLNSTHDGYDDWYLPSWMEMKNFFDRRVFETMSKTPGAMLFRRNIDGPNEYWSSFEINANIAGSLGSSQLYAKSKKQTNPYNRAFIRPVRRF